MVYSVFHYTVRSRMLDEELWQVQVVQDEYPVPPGPWRDRRSTVVSEQLCRYEELDEVEQTARTSARLRNQVARMNAQTAARRYWAGREN